MVNVIGALSKYFDIFQDKQTTRIAKVLQNDEISSERGLNQHTTLKCTTNTRWAHIIVLYRLVQL